MFQHLLHESAEKATGRDRQSVGRDGTAVRLPNQWKNGIAAHVTLQLLMQKWKFTDHFYSVIMILADARCTSASFWIPSHLNDLKNFVWEQ